MSDMLTFSTSILEAIPDFLMSEPVCYIFGLMLCLFAVKVIRNMCHI